MYVHTHTHTSSGWILSELIGKLNNELNNCFFEHNETREIGEKEKKQYSRFPKFHRVFFGPRPWHIEIRHRVKNTSTINLFGSDLRLSN